MRRFAGPIVTVAAALAAIAAWLPFLRTPLMPDEAGFLTLGEQWGPGKSLYGDYWVDRPPLLIAIYSAISAFATAGPSPDGAMSPGVRLFGGGIAGLTVLLAAALARQVAPDSTVARIGAPLLTLALVSSPLLGFPITNGELLALPFAFAGLVFLVRALQSPARRGAVALAMAAGAFALAAAMIKQNVVDVFVFALVALIGLSRRTGAWKRLAAGFLGGSALALGAIVGFASTRGTSPADLWHAVVVFRYHASALIGSNISDERADRLFLVIEAFFVSGCGVVLVVLAPIVANAARHHLEPARYLAWPTIAMAAWEVIAAGISGSYWLHYITGLIPGVVLLVILAAPLARWRTFVVAGVGLALAVNAGVWAYRITDPPQSAEDARVSNYLLSRSAPGDRAIIGFGHPNVLAGTGLRNPYPYIWSLPMRVHDPHLREVRQVLAGPEAPRWFVVHSDTPLWWNDEASDERDYVKRHYAQRTQLGEWHIFERTTRPRPDAR
ncbi:MAG TPA: hypothetical protein VJ782_08205 [Aeromicrobium sp.]|nr:hypothetical protein [Aeromicrobium sp.]